MLLLQVWSLDGYQSVKFVTSREEVSPDIESEHVETCVAICRGDFIMSAQCNNKNLSLDFVYLFFIFPSNFFFLYFIKYPFKTYWKFFFK